MDEPTFVFALVPPAMAVLTSLFASVSDAYIERTSRESVRDFERANVNAQTRSAIRDLVIRVARGALLIANLIATSLSVATGLFGAIYFLPSNYLIIFVTIAVCIVFILYLIKIMVQFGVTELYVQRRRKLYSKPNEPLAGSLTYGEFIDRALIALNVVLIAVVVIVFLFSSKTPA